MQHHHDYFINRLQSKTPGSSLGFVRALGIIVVFSAVGFLSFWSYDFLAPVFDGSHSQTITDLREQNRVLQSEMERLKTA